MQNQKLKAITNLFEVNEIRSIWNKVINSKNNLNYKYINDKEKLKTK